MSLTCQRKKAHGFLHAGPKAFPRELTWALGWPEPLAWARGEGQGCLGLLVILSPLHHLRSSWGPEAASPRTDTGTVLPSIVGLLRATGLLRICARGGPRKESRPRNWPQLSLKHPQGVRQCQYLPCRPGWPPQHPS